MTSKEVNDAVWALLPESKRSAKPKVAYLGTPTYDSKAAMERQCSALVERGAELSPVVSLERSERTKPNRKYTRN